MRSGDMMESLAPTVLVMILHTTSIHTIKAPSMDMIDAWSSWIEEHEHFYETQIDMEIKTMSIIRYTISTENTETVSTENCCCYWNLSGSVIHPTCLPRSVFSGAITPGWLALREDFGEIVGGVGPRTTLSLLKLCYVRNIELMHAIDQNW